MELTQDFAGEIQEYWHRFIQRTEAIRPELHRYCRSLTRSVWDAEDLVQDTLLRAFAKLGEFSDPIDNPKAYLFRVATNIWMDTFRREARQPRLEESGDSNLKLQYAADGSITPDRALEVRDAGRRLIGWLPPQERAAILLKDVFDFRLDEIAAILQTTVGAIKSALHRGREKLANQSDDSGGLPGNRSSGALDELVDNFVRAFNERDLDRLTSLLLEESVAETLGMGTSFGRRAISESSFYYSLFLEKGDPRAETRLFDGVPIVVVWYSDLDDEKKREVREIYRLYESGGGIARIRFYGFCPETMAEICSSLGLPMLGLGYGVWSPDFLRLRKEKEFLEWRSRQHPHWDKPVSL
jgi:RNA polymerase sigma-70 factor (ECF subfamily)